MTTLWWMNLWWQYMNDDEFINVGNNRCSSLNIVLKNEGILGGPHSARFDYDFNGSVLHIEIEQCIVRTINVSADSPIPMSNLWGFYTIMERLLMLLDGRFYIIESVTFTGDACSEANYSSYAQECLSRRLSYCKTDPAYCYSDHVFLIYDTVISPELLSKWIHLQDELDIVHQVALYNIADTGVTHDVKCANLIECLEPMAEIIGLYDSFFRAWNPARKQQHWKCVLMLSSQNTGKISLLKNTTLTKANFFKLLSIQEIASCTLKGISRQKNICPARNRFCIWLNSVTFTEWYFFHCSESTMRDIKQ